MAGGRAREKWEERRKMSGFRENGRMGRRVKVEEGKGEERSREEEGRRAEEKGRRKEEWRPGGSTWRAESHVTTEQKNGKGERRT